MGYTQANPTPVRANRDRDVLLAGGLRRGATTRVDTNESSGSTWYVAGHGGSLETEQV